MYFGTHQLVIKGTKAQMQKQRLFWEKRVDARQKYIIALYLLHVKLLLKGKIFKKWFIKRNDVAKRRLAELRSGQVQTIPSVEVFAKVKKRFA